MAWETLTISVVVRQATYELPYADCRLLVCRLQTCVRLKFLLIRIKHLFQKIKSTTRHLTQRLLWKVELNQLLTQRFSVK